MPGTQYASIQNPKMYRALRKRGYDKTAAARISNARTAGHTVKEPNYAARAGQTIAGNLARGGDGKFTSGSGSGAATDKPSPKAQQRAERQQARANEAQAEADTRAKEDAALDAAKPGKERAKLRARIAADRRNRASARRQARAAEAQAAASAPPDAKPPKEEKPKKGGGGGGGGKEKPAKPTDDEKRSAALQKKRETAAATAQSVGLKPDEAEFLRGAAEGNLPPGSFDAKRLMDLGLVIDTGDTTEATDQGRRALSALERGDTRGYNAALQDAKARMGREALAKKRQAARDAAAAERARTSGREAPTPGARRINPREGQYYTRQPGRAKSFAVFKDHQGRDRWLAITTTAYQDQDNEYISRTALKGAVRWGDRGQERGTLRYWHVPGFDLGTCDFQATTADDRLLIESGTFSSDAAATLGRRMAAKGWQMSPGFLHPADEPKAGVYDHILIFERSVCPPGKASNPYTRFVTEENTPMDDQKLAQLKELTADNPTLLESLLATATKANAAAEQAGAVYKDAPPWAQALITRLDALEAAKAAPPLPVEEMEAAAAEMGAEDELAAEAPELEIELEADDGPLLSQADADLIAQAVVLAMGPALDLEKKMRGYLDEMKGMLGTGKAAQDQTIATLTAEVAALKGEQPIASGYRASADPATALPVDLAQRLKDQPFSGGGAQPSGDPIATFLSSFGPLSGGN